MRNKISVSSKYYKTSQVKALQAHNQRHTNMTNKNVINVDIRKKHNKLFNNYNKQLNNFSDMLQKQKNIQAKNKSYHMQNSNTFYQQILIFSEEQFLQDLKNGNAKKILKSIEDYIALIEAKFGFKGLNISLHLDEGHIDKNEDLKLNIHAHLDFLNFDFAKEKTILRNLRKKDFSLMQDLAQKAFRDNGLDYERGLSKKETQAQHLEKNEFIQQKLESLEFSVKTIENMTLNLQNYTLMDIKKFKENFKEDKAIVKVLNGLYRAKNNMLKNNEKWKIDLDRAKNNYKKIKFEVKKLENVKPFVKKAIDKKIKEDKDLKNNLKDTKKALNLGVEEVERVKAQLQKINEEFGGVEVMYDEIKLRDSFIKVLEKEDSFKSYKKYVENQKLEKDKVQKSNNNTRHR